MKPSERITQLAEEKKEQGIDPGFSRYPSIENWVDSILEYLDEKESKWQIN